MDCIIIIIIIIIVVVVVVIIIIIIIPEIVYYKNMGNILEAHVMLEWPELMQTEKFKVSIAAYSILGK